MITASTLIIGEIKSYPQFSFSFHDRIFIKNSALCFRESSSLLVG